MESEIKENPENMFVKCLIKASKTVVRTSWKWLVQLLNTSWKYFPLRLMAQDGNHMKSRRLLWYWHLLRSAVVLAVNRCTRFKMMVSQDRDRLIGLTLITPWLLIIRSMLLLLFIKTIIKMNTYLIIFITTW